MIKKCIGYFKNYRAYKKEEKVLTQELASATYHALGFSQDGNRFLDEKHCCGRTIVETCDIQAQVIRKNSVASDAEFGPVTMFPFYNYPFRSMNVSEVSFSEQQKEIVTEVDKQFQPKFTALHNKYYGK